MILFLLIKIIFLQEMFKYKLFIGIYCGKKVSRKIITDLRYIRSKLV